VVKESEYISEYMSASACSPLNAKEEIWYTDTSVGKLKIVRIFQN